MIRKLRAQFVFFTMLIITIVLTIMLGILYNTAKNNIVNGSISMMRNIAMNPREHGRPDEKGEDIRLPFFTLQVNEDGEMTARGGGYYDLSDVEFLNELADIASSTEEETGVITEYNLRFLKMQNPDRNDTMIVFSDTSSGESAITGIRNSCIGAGIAAFLMLLGVSVILSGKVVKPVETAWNQQKQFIADASHELKTPLTVIMTNAEMLKEGDYSDNQKTTFIDSILKMTNQMRGLVESMLELSRLDSGTAKMEKATVNFSDVVSEAVLDFEAVFYENSRSLTSQIEEGISLMGDSGKLKELVEIFLDNAAKYSDEGTETTIKLIKMPHNQCCISVADYGDAISKQDLKNIFKRFYRADKARSMNHSYGLGLSIAENIAAAHNGKVKAESADGINTFSAILPTV